MLLTMTFDGVPHRRAVPLREVRVTALKWVESYRCEFRTVVHEAHVGGEAVGLVYLTDVGAEHSPMCARAHARSACTTPRNRPGLRSRNMLRAVPRVSPELAGGSGHNPVMARNEGDQVDQFLDEAVRRLSSIDEELRNSTVKRWLLVAEHEWNDGSGTTASTYHSEKIAPWETLGLLEFAATIERQEVVDDLPGATRSRRQKRFRRP